MRLILFTLLALLWVSSGGHARAAGPEPVGGSLRQGAFLVSSPGLVDPNFYHTVVLLIHFGADGASGLIINRPTDIPPPKLLPDIKGIDRLSEPVYFGGPVGTDVIRVLLRSKLPQSGAYKILEDVYVTASRDVLTEALRDAGSARTVRVYAGYAGWAPGQLDREFSHGDWIIMDADPESVFSDDPSRLWPDFHEGREKIRIRYPSGARDQMVSPGTVEQ